MTDLRTMARDLGGEVAGVGQILCPGPGHGPKDRSLSVRIGAAAGGFVVHSFAGDDPLAAKDYVRQRLGIPLDFEPKIIERSVLKSQEPATDRTALALRIWNEARHPGGSPVERYLTRRGLALPEAAHEVLRFHPSCPFAGSRTGAMVALVRDIVTNEPVAIHRTALNFKGCKAEVNGQDRLALGPIGSGAVKLTADENVTTCLGVGEGIESSLSLKGISEFGNTPVWSLIAAGGISAMPMLSGIEALWIAVDHDLAGLRAARTCAARWRARGAETILITPDALGADLNDIVGAHHG